jgi:hypothetical protein
MQRLELFEQQRDDQRKQAHGIKKSVRITECKDSTATGWRCLFPPAKGIQQEKKTAWLSPCGFLKIYLAILTG